MAAVAPLAPRRRRTTAGQALAPWLLLGPALAVLLVLTGYPLVKLLITSTQKYGRAQVFGKPPEFVGLDNYKAVLTDHQFWVVLGRSFAFCAVNVVLAVGIGMLVALLLVQLGRAMRLLVTVGLLLAWAMPALTAIVIWSWMFDSQYGVVNYVLTSIGIDETGHSWLLNPLSFFAVATIVITWQSVPFVAFTLYAGLTQVPDECLEAAQLDGAGPAQRFRHIVLPFVRPVLLIVTVLQVIWDLRVFTQIFALQGSGGVTSQTSTIGVYIYQVGVAQGRFDVGSAIAVILVVVMLLISVLYVRQIVRQEEL
ncbi:N,N'-diacetylchitobiose transport system permease protein [Motilibacter peucedani]|uniref:N,N'-diacetylchitobiose transport system permease protein n=1 Tax=Motilibacter peucedani TaxID=598650 RepID=A0A420XL34_9ACTN|nr:sugar ABC transporter permease [Motilibacter peucedani]RKS69371.1 N,N'-diacetylchitobiose transport system permease protein [Motilibacter peucedani]